MHLLKPIAVKIKDLNKLADTSRSAIYSLIKTPQNPSGRLLTDKVYDVYGITETQARSWSFLLVSETLEMVWVDMEYCLFAEHPAVEATAETTAEDQPVKRGRKPQV